MSDRVTRIVECWCQVTGRLYEHRLHYVQMCSPVDTMKDSETHFLAELSAKIEPSGQYQDGRVYLPSLQCNNRALKPSCSIGSVGDVDVDHKWPYNPDYDYRSSSLEKIRHVSSISDLSTMSFGGLIETSSDDVFCHSDKSTLYSNGSTSSLSPVSSAGLNNSVEEGNLSQLLYNMCLSPTATTGGRTGRPILGSQSSCSRQDRSLQDQNIRRDCKGFNRSDGFYNGLQQQETVPRTTAAGSMGLAPVEPSADALAALVHSLNYHTKQQEQQEQQQLQQRLQQLQQQRRQQLHSGLPSPLATSPGSCQHLGLPESLIGARRTHYPMPKSQQLAPSAQLPVQRRFGFCGDELLQHSVASQLPYRCQLPVRSDSRSIEEAAKQHRTAAATTQATCTWSGSVLPGRPLRDVVYSCKVFLGGVPWDITEPALASAFRQYGPIRVEWPLRDAASAQAKGYLYVLFESERLVAAMLDACIGDEGSGKRYFKISSRRMRFKEVQVIPWMIADSNHIAHSPTQQLEAQHTVFVGALHGMLTAETLARAMQNLFAGVLYAGIDTDKHKYPIGSGRVTFSNRRSFMRAVDAGFVEIKTNKFTKKVQIDPYLEDSLCSACGVQQGPYFCRDLSCFRYFCRACWNWRHSDSFTSHKPLMRNPRSSASGSGRY